MPKLPMFYDCFMQPLTSPLEFDSSRQCFGCGWMLSSVMEGSDHSMFYDCFMQPLTSPLEFNSSRQHFGCGWMLSSVME
jgi:hypothetical protein